MMYTIDVSGHDEAGKPGINRYGGLYMSVEEAAERGREGVATGRFPFKPDTLWIRDEAGEVQRKDKV